MRIRHLSRGMQLGRVVGLPNSTTELHEGRTPIWLTAAVSTFQGIHGSVWALIARGSMTDQAKMYTVVIDIRGCSGCGMEAGYTVVGPDGVEESAIYNDRGEAEEIADLMNAAYEQRRRPAA